MIDREKTITNLLAAAIVASESLEPSPLLNDLENRSIERLKQAVADYYEAIKPLSTQQLAVEHTG